MVIMILKGYYLRVNKIFQKTFQTFTGLRGFACLCVILFHLTDPPTLYNYPFLNCIAFLRLPAFIQFGLRWVDLFFILSGFVLTLKYIKNDHGNYLRNRVYRIFPLHLLILILFIITNHDSDYVDPRRFSLDTLPSNLLLVQSWIYDMRTTWNYPAWTLSSEWFLYLMFTFLVFFKKKSWVSEKVFLGTLSGILLLLISVGPFSYGILNPNLIHMDSRDFILGILLAMLSDHLWVKKIAGRLMFFWSSLILVYGLFYFEKLTQLSFGFGALVLGIYANQEKMRTWRGGLLLSRIGQMSFSLYLWHIFLLEKLAPSFFGWAPIVAVCSYFLILFLTSYLSYLFIETWLYNKLKAISSSESLG